MLALPKGHPDGDESPLDAALREVREEAGVDGRLVEKLGDVRYWYQRKGGAIPKVVTFFLFEYVSGQRRRPRPRGRGRALDAAGRGRDRRCPTRASARWSSAPCRGRRPAG